MADDVDVSAWAVFGLLVAYARFIRDLKPDSGAPALILAGVAAGVAALIAKSVSHGLAAHLLKWARMLAAVSAALPLIVATSIVLEPPDPSTSSRLVERDRHGRRHRADPDGCLPAVLAAAAESASGRRGSRVTCDDMPPQPSDFRKAFGEYHYDKPAMRVDSAEGWHTEFLWTQQAEDELTGPTGCPAVPGPPLAALRRAGSAGPGLAMIRRAPQAGDGRARKPGRRGETG